MKPFHKGHEGGGFTDWECSISCGQPNQSALPTRAIVETTGELPGPELESFLASAEAALPRHLPTIRARLVEDGYMVVLDESHWSLDMAIESGHIWLWAERDSPTAWTFVIDGFPKAPDYGIHFEFDGDKFIEVWAGD